METYDIAVIGAGAAGMMSAAVAGQLGRRVVLIDHAPRLAEKSASRAAAAATSRTCTQGPTTTCRRIRISRARRWRAIRRATSSGCSSAIT
ncbi:FAD-dependent oxidoreductase [Burkholderia sp. 1B3(2022)]|uniref:FAD-dependent oxidoreductase n=1 Tax=Burkholderia sp. 1B3(2022) TaxID=2997425 RepID=UPI002FC6EC24